MSLNRILQTNGAVLAAHPDLTAAVNRLAKDLPGIHFGATGTCGYDKGGQFDNRVWSIDLPTPGRVATAADRIVIAGTTAALDGVMDEWASIEARVRERYAAAPRQVRYGQGF